MHARKHIRTLTQEREEEEEEEEENNNKNKKNKRKKKKEKSKKKNNKKKNTIAFRENPHVSIGPFLGPSQLLMLGAISPSKQGSIICLGGEPCAVTSHAMLLHGTNRM